MKTVKTIAVAIVIAISAILFHLIVLIRLPFLLVIGTARMWATIIQSEAKNLYFHIRELWRVNYQKVE